MKTDVTLQGLSEKDIERSVKVIVHFKNIDCNKICILFEYWTISIDIVKQIDNILKLHKMHELISNNPINFLNSKGIYSLECAKEIYELLLNEYNFKII